MGLLLLKSETAEPKRQRAGTPDLREAVHSRSCELRRGRFPDLAGAYERRSSGSDAARFRNQGTARHGSEL